MSNPKEKAEELCFKFQGEFEINWTMSKRCALIAVDEILDVIEDERKGFNWKEYYKEVKQEIEKL